MASFPDKVLKNPFDKISEAFLPDRLFHSSSRGVIKIIGFLFSSFYYTNITAEIYQKLKLDIRSAKFERNSNVANLNARNRENEMLLRQFGDFKFDCGSDFGIRISDSVNHR
jgi:hypothetical protein